MSKIPSRHPHARVAIALDPAARGLSRAALRIPVGRPIAAMLSLTAAVMLAACGGSDTGGSAGSAGTGSALKATVYEGPITGFGSVVVNDVRFSESTASIVDEDGNRLSRADLSLGSVVRVEGAADDGTGTGNATRVTLLPEIRGRIEAIDATGQTLTVMGQRVVVSADTVFEGTTGLAALAIGDKVEVHGMRSADDTLQATLIEKKSALTVFAIGGTASNVDTTAKTLKIGALTIRYGNADVRPANATIADGMRVRVRAAAAPVGGIVDATRLQVRKAAADLSVADGFVALRGIVETAPGDTGLMTVSGVSVNIKDAKIRGAIAPVPGMRVKIVGSFSGDTLVATAVVTDESRQREGKQKNELHGIVTNLTDATHFLVHGVPVDATEATIEGAGPGGIQAGQFVEVHGRIDRQAGGSVLKAVRIEVKSGKGSDDDDGAGAAGREVYGAIHGFVSPADFKVNGQKVDASKAKLEGLTTLADGLFVEVEGSLVDGVLVATKVEAKRARITSVAR